MGKPLWLVDEFLYEPILRVEKKGERVLIPWVGIMFLPKSDLEGSMKPLILKEKKRIDVDLLLSG